MSIVERSHPAFRAMAPIETRCGRFSAEEIRQLVPQDLRRLGCPEAVFLSLLEDRAAEAKREGRSFRPAAVTDAEIRQRAKELGEEIRTSEAQLDAREVSRAVPEPQRMDHRVWEQ